MGGYIKTKTIAFFSVLIFAFLVILIGRTNLPIYAQESSPSPSAEVSPTPSDTSTPSPTTEPSPSLTTAPSPTATPTENPTSSPAPTPSSQPEVSTSPSPTPNVSPNPPPASSTPTPSVTSSSEEGVITAVLYTDKADYSPTETALIFGNSFTPNETYTLNITSDNLNVNVTVTADSNGNFAYSYQLDGIYRPLYNVVAKDSSGVIVAMTSFTDANIGSYDQCSNDLGTGYTSGDTGCRWINGNLNSNNSIYFEGDSTVQRLWLDGLVPGSTHTVTFQYGTTKAGKHAYDFLTTWDWSENWITVADRCQDITGCSTAGETIFTVPNDPNVTDTIENLVPARDLTMRGGTLNGITVPAIASGSYAGDSETAITVSYTASSSGPMCTTKSGTTTCGIAIWFGTHVSKTAEWQPFNGTTGATSIPGSPYHVSLAAIDGTSVGQRDNQMQSATIVVPPTTPSVTTLVQNASNANITNTSVSIGTVVHDHATVDTGSATVTIPASSTFTFHRYTTIDCTGTLTDQTGVAVPSGAQTGSANSSTFTPGVGSFSYLVDFHSGGASVTDKLGNATTDCEPFTVIGTPATTLTTKSVTPGTTVESGIPVTITVTETNTGNVTLSSVNVTGTGCTTWTGGASTLAPSASTDFSCTFTPSSTTGWTATGHGNDPLGNPAPSTNETTGGTVTVIHPATTLTTKSVAPGTTVESGTPVTITVTEDNTGDSALTGVSVSGTGCTSWTGGSSTLAVGASTDFTCTYTPGATSWTADGHGTDSLGNAVPTTGEHTSGTVTIIHPATALVTTSVLPSDTVQVGTPVTITVTETNTGDDALTGVAVTGTGCTSWTGGASTLAPSVSTAFSCTFTPGTTIGWTADGHGTDSLGNAVPTTGEHTSGTVTVVNLKINIDSNSTNEINHSHTFTVTVNSDPGTGSFGPLSGATVTSGVTGVGSITGGTCTTTTTDGSGHCTIVANSPSSGVGTVNASVTASVNGSAPILVH